MRRYFPSSVLTYAVVLLLTLVVLALALTLGVVPATGPATARLSAEQRPLPDDPTLVAARAALQDGPESPSLSLTRLALAYPRLSESDREQAAALLARPTDGAADPFLDGYPASAPTRRRCTEHFCLHYVTRSTHAPPMQDADGDGTPTWVERIRTRVEAVWAHHVDTLGYRAPARDGRRGGDARFDLYLAELGDQGVYGYCPAERAVPGQGYVYSSYCVLDNDFAEFGSPPMRTFRVTLAHEFFHAVQYSYDAAEDGWLMEATATWMEERFADGVDDNRQYLRFGQLGDPSVPLDQSSAGVASYGNWIFIEALARAYGDQAVREVWEWADAATGAPDLYATRAVNRFLRDQGSSLREFYAAFAAGNLVPGTVFEEGAVGDYPTPPVTSTVLRPGRPAYSSDLRLNHLTSTTLAVRPGRALVGRWRLGLDLVLPRRAADVVVSVEYADGSRRVRHPTVERGGVVSVRARFGAATVDRVLVTLTNSSLRFTCWQDSAFSCQGVSQDDMIDTYQVRASLQPPP